MYFFILKKSIFEDVYIIEYNYNIFSSLFTNTILLVSQSLFWGFSFKIKYKTSTYLISKISLFSDLIIVSLQTYHIKNDLYSTSTFFSHLLSALEIKKTRTA